MRNPNGYGTVRKLSGKRRRPFAVYITTGFELSKPVPDIEFLKDIIDKELFEQVSNQYEAYKQTQMPKSRQKQKCIGYYTTRQEAMIALADYNKNPFDIDKRNTTFSQVYEILLKEKFEKMKPSAKSSYVSTYKKCESLYNIRMVEMRKAHMQKVVDDSAGMSKATLTNYLKLFHAIYKFALENDICEKDYSAFVTIEATEEVEAKVPFNRDEIETLWNNINWVRDPYSPHTLAGMKFVDMVLIHIYTGVRPIELFDMKKQDVHLDERWIDLRGTKTKAAKRIVPIHKKIIPLLEKRIAEADNDYLFPNSKGKPFDGNVYRAQVFNHMCDYFKMSHTPHECRHTFATFAAASSMNKVLLKKIIGHAAGDLTEDTYTHAFIEDLVKEIDKLNI